MCVGYEFVIRIRIEIVAVAEECKTYDTRSAKNKQLLPLVYESGKERTRVGELKRSPDLRLCVVYPRLVGL